MTNLHNIENILITAKTKRWPYPKTFDMLEKSGVRSYTVNFTNQYKTLYQGDFGIWQEATPAGYHSLTAAAQFSGQGVKASIIKHMQEKNSYIEFLEEIAGHGSSHYTVDMSKRTVTYFNVDETQFHVENVPHWKE